MQLQIYSTQIQEPLSSFVGIHIAFLKHCVNIIVIVVPCDLLDVLDCFPNIARNQNPSTVIHVSQNTRSRCTYGKWKEIKHKLLGEIWEDFNLIFGEVKTQP